VIARARDIAVAAVGLVLGAPPGLVIALAIKLDSAGPVLYRRRCYGRHGRTFTLYRFRSMPQPPDDTRTRVGRALIRASLDEWPLLWNVLRGDMSLVGPRAEEVGSIDPRHPEWAEVLRHRPGATSAALVVLGGDFNRTSHQRRRAIELQHVRSSARAKDLRVLRATARALVTRGNVKR
jgi:lipopolysaccharide/colanic/teichoic acid biosynthesis glycosyltransferase